MPHHSENQLKCGQGEYNNNENKRETRQGKYFYFLFEVIAMARGFQPTQHPHPMGTYPKMTKTKTTKQKQSKK